MGSMSVCADCARGIGGGTGAFSSGGGGSSAARRDCLVCAPRDDRRELAAEGNLDPGVDCEVGVDRMVNSSCGVLAPPSAVSELRRDRCAKLGVCACDAYVDLARTTDAISNV